MASIHLGDLGGTTHDQVDGDFTWLGEQLRIHPDLTDLVILDMAEAMGSLDENDEDDAAEALKLVRRMGSVLVHPDDLALFWQTARRHRQTMGDVAELAGAVVAGLADRPTPAASGSSDAQHRTGTSSTDASSSRAMAEVAHRPDLAVAVLRSEEARLAS